MTRSRFGLVMIAALALMLVPSLSAATCSSTTTTTCSDQLTLQNVPNFSPAMSSYGTVTLTQSGSNVNFVVSLTSGYIFVNKGFGFNSTLSGLTGTTTSPSTGFNNPATSGNQFDGFGTFDYQVSPTGGGLSGGVAGPLDFTVDSVTIAQLLDNSTGGGTPSLFVAEVGYGTPGSSGGCTAVNGVVPGSCTGFVATGASPVPEPTSYLILLSAGFGVMAFVFERRRRSSGTQA